jgi:glycosyltransferase involved in cell wall biosynthesis
MPKLSFVIATKNEIALLRPTLAALDFADEIVVIDEFSTDGTPELVRSTPRARLIQRTALLNENINAGLDAATGDWIMIVDSDEVVTPELAREIRSTIADAPSDVHGFEVPSLVYWCGRVLRYGPQYDPHAKSPGERFRKRLFRRGAARYECKSLHEDLTVTGRWERLTHHYDHFTVPSLAKWFEKRNFYSERDAKLADLNGYSERAAAISMLWKPLKTFLAFYFKRRGYKDGALGVATCACYAVSSFMEEAKKWERVATTTDAASRSRDVDAARAVRTNEIHVQTNV